MKWFLLLCCCIFSTAYGQDTAQLRHYFENNQWAVREQAPDPFSFDTAFYNQRLFLLGDIHGYARSQELDFLLLKDLYQKAGVRHYMAEIDEGQAWLFNKYLETGDEQFLQPVFDYWIAEGAQWGNKDFYRKLQKIYAWNKTLPPGQKITFVGVDGIQGLPVTVQYLHGLLKGHIRPERQWPLMSRLLNLLSADSLSSSSANSPSRSSATPPTRQSADSLFRDSCRKTLQILVTDMDGHSGNYERRLGDHHFYVRHLLQNLADYFNEANREGQLSDNFISLYHYLHLEQEKLYGFFGFFHTLQGKVNGGYVFAGTLEQSDLPLSGHIVSLNAIYTESDMMIDGSNKLPLPPFIPQDRLKWVPNRSNTRKYLRSDIFSQDGFLMKVNGINLLKQVSVPDAITIFDLRGASPYLSSYKEFLKPVLPVPAQYSIRMDETGKSYFQYLVLIRHSAWAEPFLDR